MLSTEIRVRLGDKGSLWDIVEAHGNSPELARTTIRMKQIRYYDISPVASILICCNSCNNTSILHVV